MGKHKEQHKISAYVDDLLFSLTNPAISLPNLLCEFETYGKLLNLKIYFSQSGAMGFGASSDPEVEFQIQMDGFGFEIPRNIYPIQMILYPLNVTFLSLDQNSYFSGNLAQRFALMVW